MQLKVIKADGTVEGIPSHKVLATFVNAFARPSDTFVSGELADALTFTCMAIRLKQNRKQ